MTRPALGNLFTSSGFDSQTRPMTLRMLMTSTVVIGCMFPYFSAVPDDPLPRFNIISYISYNVYIYNIHISNHINNIHSGAQTELVQLREESWSSIDMRTMCACCHFLMQGDSKVSLATLHIFHVMTFNIFQSFQEKRLLQSGHVSKLQEERIQHHPASSIGISLEYHWMIIPSENQMDWINWINWWFLRRIPRPSMECTWFCNTVCNIVTLGWWFGTFFIFHNIWDKIILTIDFHIFPDG